MYTFNAGSNEAVPLSNVPSSMLPDQGSNFPAYPGNSSSDPSQIPGNMLPEPDINLPAYPGNSSSDPSQIPGNMLPEPDINLPAYPGNTQPIIPNPDVNQGGSTGPNRPGSIIIPGIQVNPPCFYCSPSRNAKVRFLNAAYGYSPFRVYINNRFLVNGLGYASLTPYGRVASGFQTITIRGMNGYLYLRKSIPISNNDTSTIAIINKANGIDLVQISDTTCSRPRGISCLRMVNLATNTNPLDLLLSDGRMVFSDVELKEVTSFRRARPGEYEFSLADTNIPSSSEIFDIDTIDGDFDDLDLPNILVTFFVEIQANSSYTIYVLSRTKEKNAIQVLTIQDR